MRSRSLRRDSRRATTTVEVAFMLPVFLLFLFGSVQFGHAVLVDTVLKSACREAARYGSTEGVTTAEVIAKAQGIISSTVDINAVTLMVKDAAYYDENTHPNGYDELPDVEVADAEVGDMILVRATVNYRNVALIALPLLDFVEDIPLVGQSFTRHE